MKRVYRVESEVVSLIRGKGLWFWFTPDFRDFSRLQLLSFWGLSPEMSEREKRVTAWERMVVSHSQPLVRGRHPLNFNSCPFREKSSWAQDKSVYPCFHESDQALDGLLVDTVLGATLEEMQQLDQGLSNPWPPSQLLAVWGTSMSSPAKRRL